MVVRDYERLNFALFLVTRDGAEFRVERERDRDSFLIAIMRRLTRDRVFNLKEERDGRYRTTINKKSNPRRC